MGRGGGGGEGGGGRFLPTNVAGPIPPQDPTANEADAQVLVRRVSASGRNEHWRLLNIDALVALLA